jgi:hypothetical protein
MKLKTEDKFVQLGQTKKGKIIKMERYNVKTFLMKILPLNKQLMKEPNIIHRIFKTKKYLNYLFYQNVVDVYLYAKDSINKLIKEDNIGRTKK